MLNLLQQLWKTNTVLKIALEITHRKNLKVVAFVERICEGGREEISLALFFYFFSETIYI